MRKKILFGWLPPAMENSPAPSLSVLKPVLNQLNYDVTIKYWNIALNPLIKSFFNLEDAIYETELHKLMPFLLNSAIKEKDSEVINKIKYYIYSQKPQLHHKGNEYMDSYLRSFNDKLEEWIDNEIKHTKFDDYLLIGFSAHFYQWLVANLFIEKIKSAFPNTTILIGGFGTKEEATTFLQNFPNVNYASWGEGEYALQQLVLYLDKENIPISSIPNTAYRIDTEIKTNPIRNTYRELNQLSMDFSDYFNTVENHIIDQNIVLPIEGGRGCSWKRCKFCFLNSGYKYRTKSNKHILAEIKKQTSKHNINRIMFLDNDIIGADINNFLNLLDLLIEYRKENNDFSILLAEIVTKNIPFNVIKKMALAGFESVQIGYESPSNKLLAKIHKKNTFASNLFFIKWANELGIHINGANVLRNLLEETVEDIKESIDNIYFMRFYLQKRLVYHSYSHLSVAKSSPYYKTLQKTHQLEEWQESNLSQFTSSKYIPAEDKFILFFDFVKSDYNHLWDVFQKIEQHYINNMYDYQFVLDNSTIYYREFYNNSLIKEIEFDTKDIYWLVLQICNMEILSINQLSGRLNNYTFKDGETLSEVVSSLQKEGLLYCNSERTEILTIVETQKAISATEYKYQTNIA